MTETTLNKNEQIISVLQTSYPDAHCELDFNSTFELLVAVILSAQCTDRRVNIVTKTLFERANTPEQFAVMDIEELETLIHSCGFYHNKAKNIILASQAILQKFNGQVPEDFNDLLSLPGVGRKTANVVISVAFNGDGIAVDTHVFRTANRLKLAVGKTPYEVEKGLEKIIPEGSRAAVHHLLIFHGRYTCKAIKPLCEQCNLRPYCDYYNKENDNV